MLLVTQRACRILLSFALAGFLASCHSERSGDSLDSLGGTTIDNGRKVPSGIIVQYSTQGAAVDLATQQAVEAVLSSAKAAGQVSSVLPGPNGVGVSECVQFRHYADATTFHHQICDLIAKGNARAGTTLTMHSFVLKCTDDVLASPLSSDQGCN